MAHMFVTIIAQYVNFKTFISGKTPTAPSYEDPKCCHYCPQPRKW